MRLTFAVAIGLAASVARAQPASEPVAPSTCADPQVASRLGALLHARRFADVHHAATSLRVLCGPIETTQILDDIALLRLEDRAYALHDLDGQTHGAHADVANVVLAWAYVTDRDGDAARIVLSRIPPPRAAALAALAEVDDREAFASRIRGLPPPIEQRAGDLAGRYHDARQKHPALAGILSALLPGAGQIYAGSLQAAAVTFVLNGLFIGATVEQLSQKHYFTGAAAGTAASFFYVGGIMNAVDLARRRNRIAQQPYADQLEQLLVPEVDGSFR